MDYRDSQRRIQTENKIKEYEQLGLFNDDVEEDPPYDTLDPKKIDLYNKKIFSKVKQFFSNRIARAYINREIKKKVLIFDSKCDVQGMQNLIGVNGGAIVTLNHVHPYDHFLAYLAFRRQFGYFKFRLFKVIKESNYTYPGWIGVFMRNCNTIPVSETNIQLNKHSFDAVQYWLKRGKKICIFAESSLWHHYKKPRPTKLGAFVLAAKNSVPVIPCFLTMSDSDLVGKDGLIVQKFKFHIMPVIYPDKSLSVKANSVYLQEQNAKAWQKCYEVEYEKPLEYEK
ncbi:MAG: 1-acyl-sn-glycerol-3-phosphate acyltransferase [Clostridiales bacterium]|jgi:1-acyl-sn-glycerol-3-phosphate acyltransferase|nr:1-acyl-sn-glycerol-3-phosphate acyltransferase [Clostridiales bacterium]